VTKNSKIILCIILFSISVNISIPLIGVQEQKIGNEESIYDKLVGAYLEALTKHEENKKFKFTLQHIQNELKTIFYTVGITGTISFVANYFLMKWLNLVDTNSKVKNIMEKKENQEIHKDIIYEFAGNDAFSRHYALQKLVEDIGTENENNNRSSKTILLLGPTGTGKTYFAKFLSSHFEYPLYKVASIINQLSRNGISDPIDTIFQYIKNNINTSQRVILLLDEFKFENNIEDFLRSFDRDNIPSNVICIATFNGQEESMERRVTARFDMIVTLEIILYNIPDIFHKMLDRKMSKDKIVNVFGRFSNTINNAYYDANGLKCKIENFCAKFNFVPPSLEVDKQKEWTEHKEKIIKLYNTMKSSLDVIERCYDDMFGMSFDSKIPAIDSRTLEKISVRIKNRYLDWQGGVINEEEFDDYAKEIMINATHNMLHYSLGKIKSLQEEYEDHRKNAQNFLDSIKEK